MYTSIYNILFTSFFDIIYYLIVQYKRLHILCHTYHFGRLVTASSSWQNTSIYGEETGVCAPMHGVVIQIRYQYPSLTGIYMIYREHWIHYSPPPSMTYLTFHPTTHGNYMSGWVESEIGHGAGVLYIYPERNIRKNMTCFKINYPKLIFWYGLNLHFKKMKT